MQVIREDGTVVNRYDYDAFGNALAANTSEQVENRYRFQGREYDAHRGDYYFRNRTYIPEWGVFTGPDALVQMEANGPCNYLFANNNPLRYVDPEGLRTQEMVREFLGLSQLYRGNLLKSLEKLGDALDDPTTTDAVIANRLRIVSVWFEGYQKAKTRSVNEAALLMGDTYWLSSKSSRVIQEVQALPDIIANLRPSELQWDEIRDADLAFSQAAEGLATRTNRLYWAAYATDKVGTVAAVATGVGGLVKVGVRHGSGAVVRVVVRQGGKMLATQVAIGILDIGLVEAGFSSDQIRKIHTAVAFVQMAWMGKGLLQGKYRGGFPRNPEDMGEELGVEGRKIKSGTRWRPSDKIKIEHHRAGVHVAEPGKPSHYNVSVKRPTYDGKTGWVRVRKPDGASDFRPGELYPGDE
jgi:RHS repeat-associated protein